MDPVFMFDTFVQLLAGVPLLLQLAILSVSAGAVIGMLLALMIRSRIPPLYWFARSYIFVFRGTPLLVQIFLIYYGLSQFPVVRHSIFWPFLREPYWCTILALTLNTAAYGAEIVRGGLQAVPHGQIEAARACGMSGVLLFRRIIFPIAIRQALPIYGNELILMVKATSLGSIVTLAEVTGIAQRLIAETYRAVEIFVCAGVIYLAINFLLTRAIAFIEHRLSAHMRTAQPSGATLSSLAQPIDATHY